LLCKNDGAISSKAKKAFDGSAYCIEGKNSGKFSPSADGEEADPIILFKPKNLVDLPTRFLP